MKLLLFINSETKNQFARDDPAFLTLLSLVLLISSLMFGLVMQLSAFNLFKFVIWVICIDCIGVGLLIASIYWFVANKFLIKNDSSNNTDVEWAYCFDVHLNAFLPLIIVLHVFQLPFVMSKFDFFIKNYLIIILDLNLQDSQIFGYTIC